MTLPLTHIDRVVAITTAALPDWTPVNVDSLSRYRRDYEWSQSGRQVHLAVWDSSNRAYVAISYRVGGAEVGHCVLSDVDQVRAFLRLHGVIVATVAEVAEAALIA